MKRAPAPITLRITDAQRPMLEALLATGLYGKTINDVAERLLSESLAKRFLRTKPRAVSVDEPEEA